MKGCLICSCLVVNQCDSVLVHDYGSLGVGELGLEVLGLEALVISEFRVIQGWGEALVTGELGVVLGLGEALVAGVIPNWDKAL